jgi:PilZ domain
MAFPLPHPDPLVAHFSGKRRFERVPFTCPVDALGKGGEFAATVHDVSEGGVLLQVTDPRFYEDAPPPGDGFTLVARAFPEGLRIRFPGSEVVMAAEVVRITSEAEGALCLGCRFVRPLSEVERVLIGVDADHPAANGDPDEALPWVPAQADRTTVLLYNGEGSLLGPRYVAAPVALGPHHLVLHLDGSTLDARVVATAVAGLWLHVALVVGRRRLWEGAARVTTCLPAQGGAVRMRLLLREPMGRAVRRHMRRAPRAVRAVDTEPERRARTIFTVDGPR